MLYVLVNNRNPFRPKVSAEISAETEAEISVSGNAQFRLSASPYFW